MEYKFNNNLFNILQESISMGPFEYYVTRKPYKLFKIL